MQPLCLAADPEAGFIQVLDRRHRDQVAHGIDEARVARGAIATDPRDGRSHQSDAEKIGHQDGQTLLGQQLVVQEIQHERTDPLAILHRCAHPVRERCSRLRSARGTAAAMRAVLGDDQRFRFRQIEPLPGDVINRHRFGQRLAARGAGSRIVVDRGIRGFPCGAASFPDDPADRRSSCRLAHAGC